VQPRIGEKKAVRPLLHPYLVNGRTGDPAVYVDALFASRAMLFDIGDIAALPPRKILRLEQVFVSHTHIDHFVGFDRLLRLMVGREKTVRMFGPAGFLDHVDHKLHGYQWNLAGSYDPELVFEVTEVVSAKVARTARFRLKTGFAKEGVGDAAVVNGVIHGGGTFHVATAMLEHRDTTSLGFAIKETAHANVWKNRLQDLQLPVGPWLQNLKRAVLADEPPDTLISVGTSGGARALGELRDAVAVTPGQKIGYVTDVADTPANRSAILALVAGADILFIEAVFARDDADLAQRSGHLTTTAAGEIARAAGVGRVEPFHFSARYSGDHSRLLEEVTTAFEGRSVATVTA
jgi:ribonuclease Z